VLTTPTTPTHEVAPPVLVNATLGLFPVLLGFLAQNILVEGEIQASSTLIFVFAVQNLCLCYFWRRLKSPGVKTFTLVAVITGQWSYVVLALSSIYIAWPPYSLWVAFACLALMVSAFVLFIARLGWERSGSAAVFAVMGIFGMCAAVWRGIDDWSVQLSSRPSRILMDTKHSKRTPHDNGSLPTAKILNASWSYAGDTGPDVWGAIKEEFKTCAVGSNQSPVDIPKRTPVLRDDIQVNWKAEKGLVLNNGHTIQVNFSGQSTAKIAGQTYALKQFHIHTPSEHQVSGLSYPMELHFIHSTPDGRLAVVAVFVEIGAANDEFGKIMPFMPSSSTSAPTATVPLNLAAILPIDSSLFRYHGSLTTPPCSEGVLWSVLSQPVELSMEQVTAFRRLFPVNARPVQPMGNRVFEVQEKSMAH
jgi:carbonic anhydrase